MFPTPEHLPYSEIYYIPISILLKKLKSLWKIDLATGTALDCSLRMQRRNTGFPVDTEVEGMPTGVSVLEDSEQEVPTVQ